LEIMRVHERIVAQRLALADLLAGLTPAQLARPSLCTEWTVHELAAHLTTYLHLAQPKIYLGIALTAGDLDRWNLRLTRMAARRDITDLVDRLRRGAASRGTIPLSGYDPILADVVLHDLDIRRPLSLRHDLPEASLRVTFDHLAQRPVPGYSMGSRLKGLRVETSDTGWRHGSGPTVRGRAEDVVLAMAGRSAVLGELTGDGVPLLARRIRSTPKPPATERMLRVARVVVRPAPATRRSRRALAPG
jgi:uncharacterized protein (TIGR03083 family)